METQFTPWMVAAAPRWRALVAAYRAAIEATSTPDSKMALMGELIDVAEWTVAGLSAAEIAALPAEWRSNNASLELATQTVRAKASTAWLTSVVGGCIALASQLQNDGAVSKRCSALAKQLAPVDAPKPTLATGDGNYAIPTHPWVATTHAAGCSFGGSVRLQGESLYADALATKPFAVARFDVVVDRLDPPATAGGRSRATISWPVKGTVWLASTVRLFEVPVAVTAVASHVWIEAGTYAAGRASTPSEVTLTSDCRAETCRNLVAPRVAPVLRKSCDLVSLAGSTRLRPTSDPEAEWRLLARHPIALSADATGAPVATLSGGGGVTLVETSGHRAHVRGSGVPWTIDGWIASSDFDPERPRDTVGIIGSIVGAPHRVVSDARVLGGEHGEKPPLTLPVGALVFVTAKHDASCAVSIPSLEPATADAPFMVACAALEPASAQPY
jgi:hypothetical protein